MKNRMPLSEYIKVLGIGKCRITPRNDYAGNNPGKKDDGEGFKPVFDAEMKKWNRPTDQG